MKRREFITVLGGAAAWPLAARAQRRERMRRVGVLLNGAEDAFQASLPKFRQGLETLGWSPDRNIRIDYRFASAVGADQASVLARELVALQPEVIFVSSTPLALALQHESQVIPIVFVDVSDPIGSGFIVSLARPGGNMTGLLLIEASITGKWLAMVKEIAPRTSHAALMASPKTTPFNYFLREAELLAPRLGVELVPAPVETAADIERAIKGIARVPGGALVLPPDATNTAHRNLIITLAAQHGLPAVYYDRVWVAVGGLIVLRARAPRAVSAGCIFCGSHFARRQTR